jgi:hypothetical protein
MDILGTKKAKELCQATAKDGQEPRGGDMSPKPPWVGEPPTDPENCVIEHPSGVGRVVWGVRKKAIAWKVLRQVSKRYTDKNHGEIEYLSRHDLVQLIRKVQTDKTLVITEEVFGAGDIFCKAMQLDRSLCPCINDHGHKRKQPNTHSQRRTS